jgi:hypothetical protein
MNAHVLRRFVAGSLALGALAAAAPASADVQACLTASEKGQRARTAGKLREARESFVVCGAESCPALVRHDCAQWNSELASSLPTVVFGARDKAGRDLFDVTVSMDGEVLVKKLDGKSVTVDPGKHTFRFEAAGFPAVSEVVLVKEGERARVFNVTFDTGGGSVTTGPTSNTAATNNTTTSLPPPPPPGRDTVPPPPTREHTPYPWIVVGVGAAVASVGAVIFLTTPDRPSNCNEATQKCTRIEGQTEEDFRKDQERAGTADSQPVLGLAVGGIGLALVVGGLVWHFLEPTGDVRGTRSAPSSSAWRVTPWTTGQSSGFAFGGRF